MQPIKTKVHFAIKKTYNAAFFQKSRPIHVILKKNE